MSPISVLLVEDDDDLFVELADGLTFRGFTVRQARNGVEALQQMRAQLPSIVVLDLMMPVMDGWEFRREQRADAALAGVPVVAMSASRAPAAGAIDADAFVPKPFSAVTLADSIEWVLRRRARHR